METSVENGPGLLAPYAFNVLAGVAILLIGWFLARIVTRALRRLMARAGVEPTLIGFCANLVYIGLLAIVVIAALDKFGVPTISFVGVVGAAGLAIGLALKGTLSDLASGVMLITFRPFKVGDRIEAAGTSGVVKAIQVFATTVQAAEDKTVIIPNSAITRGNITNYSA